MKKTELLTLSLVLLTLFAAATPAQAGGCLHAKAVADTCVTPRLTRDLIIFHTGRPQGISQDAFRPGLFGFAWAFAHMSQHSSGIFHRILWAWAPGPCTVASAHGSHPHCSEPHNDDGQGDGEDLIPPPPESEFQGSFGIVDLEVTEVAGGVSISWAPGRLQIDSTDLVEPADVALSTLDIVTRDGAGVLISSATGRMSVILEGGSGDPLVTKSGLFVGIETPIEQVGSVFQVRFDPDDIFIPGVGLEELDMSVDLEAGDPGVNEPQPVPAVSAWGMAVLSLVLLIGLGIKFRKRRVVQES